MLIKSSKNMKSMKAVCLKDKSSKVLVISEEKSFIKGRTYNVYQVDIEGDNDTCGYKCISENGVEHYFTKGYFNRFFRLVG